MGTALCLQASDTSLLSNIQGNALYLFTSEGLSVLMMMLTDVFPFDCSISLLSPPPPGITEWETILPSFDLSSDGSVRCSDADWLEPVPLPHLPLQNLFCAQPALPLLPVSTHRKNNKSHLIAEGHSLLQLILSCPVDTHSSTFPRSLVHLDNIFDVINIIEVAVYIACI